MHNELHGRAASGAAGDDPVPGDGSGFDAAEIVARLSLPQLLALQDAAEVRLQNVGSELGARDDNGLLDVLETREATRRRREVFDAALYTEISDRSVYRISGHNTMHQLYAFGVRLGAGEAQRRRVTAASVGSLTGLTGEKLAPVFPATTAGVTQGVIGREHVLVIAEVMDKIPAAVATDDRDRAEAMLADAATRLDPAALAAVGNRILAYLDPDGTLADERERARRRALSLQAQNRQLMSKIRACCTPLLRANLEIVFAQWAALGMNNPDDPDSPRGAADQPGLDQTVLAAAARRDQRSRSQRQHDALLALLVWVNGQTAAVANGAIASQIVVTVSDADLARGAGVAQTATGTRLPISDLVQLAATTVPYLAVFAGATSQVLYLGRARFASAAQRLALFARDRGCTVPGCTVPFAQCEAHHMPDYRDGGTTDPDHLGAACGGHNRANGTLPGQWESTVLTSGPETGRVGWRPAGRKGPWMTNPMFHPDKLGASMAAPPGLSTRLIRDAESEADTGPPGGDRNGGSAQAWSEVLRVRRVSWALLAELDVA